MTPPREGIALALVCEGPDDRFLFTTLTDRVLVSTVPWLDGVLEECRRWQGEHPEERFLPVKDITMRSRRLPSGGFAARTFQIQPQFGGVTDGEFSQARGALLLFQAQDEAVRPDAVVLTRDDDGKSKLASWEKAVTGYRWSFPIVLGMPRIMAEAWYLAGFEPKTGEESERLQLERKTLGFDPTLRAEELTASDKTALRSPKRVLSVLTQDVDARREQCVAETPLSTLDARGGASGLVDFLTQVQGRLSPVFGGPRTPARQD